MDHAPYCVNNAAARGEAAATSQKRSMNLPRRRYDVRESDNCPRTFETHFRRGPKIWSVWI